MEYKSERFKEGKVSELARSNQNEQKLHGVDVHPQTHGGEADAKNK